MLKRNATAWSALLVAALALASSQGLTPKVPAAPEIPAEGQRTAKALSEAFEAVADFVKPSVVQISVHRKQSPLTIHRGRGTPIPDSPDDMNDFRDMLKKFFGPDALPERQQLVPPEGKGIGTGSGFVYDDKGHILTNNHVVSHAEKITVTFHDGQEVNATVVGTDPATDVAVIKVDNTAYRPVVKGQSKKLRVGEWVMAVGSPFGLDQTVTAGIISATERNQVGINQYESFIQTDASINPGNSGGPLVDMAGHVIGINSAIVTGSHSNAGVGFAIPMDMAGMVADKLIKDGKVSRARLGLKFDPMTPALARQLGLDEKTKGLMVSDISKGSPSEKAGLKEGDVIIKYDGVNVLNGSLLRNAVATSDVGKEYNLTVLRDGHELKLQVVPAPEDKVKFAFEGEENEPAHAKPEAPKAQVNDFGLAVQLLTPELASHFGYPKGTEGLVVTDVKDGSPADAAGIKEGDLITRVIKDRRPQAIKGVKEFQDLANHSDELAVHVRSAANPEHPGQYVTLSKNKKD
jgi:serine protease Do